MQTALSASAGVSVAVLLDAHPGFAVDVVWAMLTSQRIFTDLSVCDLMYWDQVRLYLLAEQVEQAKLTHTQAEHVRQLSSVSQGEKGMSEGRKAMPTSSIRSKTADTSSAVCPLFRLRRTVSLSDSTAETIKVQPRSRNSGSKERCFSRCSILMVASKVTSGNSSCRVRVMRRAWGVESEITKGHIKTGHGTVIKHFTPFALLDQIMQGQTTLVPVFQEYAKRFKGRHQLHWSKGLRKRLLGTDEELTDEEVAADQDDAILLGLLTRAQWRVILANDVRGELLEVARSGDWQQVETFLGRLGCDLSQAEPTPA